MVALQFRPPELRRLNNKVVVVAADEVFEAAEALDLVSRVFPKLLSRHIGIRQTSVHVPDRPLAAISPKVLHKAAGFVAFFAMHPIWAYVDCIDILKAKAAEARLKSVAKSIIKCGAIVDAHLMMQIRVAGIGLVAFNRSIRFIDNNGVGVIVSGPHALDEYHETYETVPIVFKGAIEEQIKLSEASPIRLLVERHRQGPTLSPVAADICPLNGEVVGMRIHLMDWEYCLHIGVFGAQVLQDIRHVTAQELRQEVLTPYEIDRNGNLGVHRLTLFR